MFGRGASRCAAWMVGAMALVGLVWGAHAQQSIEKVDPNMATMDASGKWRWYDAQQLTVEGMGWKDTKTAFDRLPASAEGKVDANVWGLSGHSAGIAVRFSSNSKDIAVRWTVSSDNLSMPHMPSTGVSGLDLYVRQEGVWRWIGNARPQSGRTSENTIVRGLPDGSHDFCLYLPLYNGTDALSIGVTPEAEVAKAPERVKPVCFYGTSIVHGGCASRPGMAYPAILGRRLDVPTINLGFSGNGKMQPPVVELLAELDPGAYVIDCAPNMDPGMIRERFAPLVHALRKAHPDTPIVVVECVFYQAGFVLPEAKNGTETKNVALHEVYDALVKEGVTGLYYCPTEKLLGNDGEATVDGVHPTDLGFFRMADAIEPILKAALAKK